MVIKMSVKNAKIVELNTGGYHDFLKNNRVVLVDYWAGWCMPCVMQGNLLERSMDKLPEGGVIAKLNVDESPEIANELGIQSIPQLTLFVDGKSVKGWTGVTPAEVIFSEMKAHL